METETNTFFTSKMTSTVETSPSPSTSAGDLLKRVMKLYDEETNMHSDSSIDSGCPNPTDSRTPNDAACTFARRLNKHLGNKMGDQGVKEYDGEDFENSRSIVDFEARKLDVDVVDFEGSIFERNNCYCVENRVFAIIYFLREGEDEQSKCSSAYCTEVIRFRDTVLEKVHDTSGMEGIAPQRIHGFVQRAGYKAEIPLADLEEEEDCVENIPEWMYIERQRGSSCLLFGFVHTSKIPERYGKRQTERKCIDFFAGAGLASSGFESHGFKIVTSIEKNEDAVRSYARIHKAKFLQISSAEWKNSLNKEGGRVAFCGTVKDFLLKYKDIHSFREALEPIDLVILCPPCQGFSKANIFKAGETEQNNDESLRTLEAARLIRPKVLVFENVLGLWEKVHIEKYLQKIVYGLMNFGYNVQVGQLCAADFGDPQKRPRLILIASLSEIGLPVFPRPTHGQPFMGSDASGALLPYETVRDALRPEEGKHPQNETPVTRECDPKPNEPASAVMASKSAPHYCENRKYTLGENAILMGQEGSKFVEKLEGDEKSKQRQIGNGVPMELTRAISKAIDGVLRYNWVGVDSPGSTSSNNQAQESCDEEVAITNGQTEANGDEEMSIANNQTEEDSDAEGKLEIMVKNEAVPVKNEIVVKIEPEVVKSEIFVKTEAGVKSEADDERDSGVDATDAIHFTDDNSQYVSVPTGLGLEDDNCDH